MEMNKSAIATALLAACAAWGQSISFEVASVKQATADQARRRASVSGDRIEFRNVTLWYCLSFAYGMKSYQMFGPDWLREARYEIVAKAPAGTRREDLPKMMQALLAERFKVQTHQEAREIPAVVLTRAKEGPKLKEAGPESGDGQGGAQVGMSATESGGERLEVKGGTMSTLVNTLTGLLGRPVVDQTGLTGRYDFILEFSRSETAGPNATGGYNEPPQLPPPPPGAEPGLSIYSSIQQLGLKLVGQKLPVKVLIIDSAERVPIEN
ncbi:MAG TPA: TIGR03435 family protein [Bryobacteraceae bacterium]|jgi:uncharacterized protein (TIGR03435 family)